MLVQIRDNQKTLISISNYDRYQIQVGMKLNQNGTTDGTSEGTTIDYFESAENSKEEQLEDMDWDMSRDM